MSRKSFDVLCGAGWSWVSRARPEGPVLVWDECSVTCRKERANIPSCTHLKEPHLQGGRPWESHPHIHRWVRSSKCNWLSLPGREWIIIDPGSHGPDNSFCLLLFQLLWLLLPSSDVCCCGRGAGGAQDKIPALLPVSYRAAAQLGQAKVRAFGHYKKVWDENGYFDRRGKNGITGGRVKAHS